MSLNLNFLIYKIGYKDIYFKNHLLYIKWLNMS